MKTAFRIYSDVLQLRTKAYLTLKHANGGLRYALGMFIVVGLVAGAGLWIGLPAVLQRPTLAEQIDQASAVVDRIDREVVPLVSKSLDSISREKLSLSLGDAMAAGGGLSADTLSTLVNRVGLRPAEIAAALSVAAGDLSADAGARLREQAAALQSAAEADGRVTPEQIDQLLSKTQLTADQLAGLLARAASAPVPQGAAAGQTVVQSTQLAGLLAQIPVSAEQVQALVARLALAPERVSNVTLQLGLAPEQIGSLRSDIEAAPKQVKQVLAQVRAGAEQVQPPLGERFSRFVRMLGNWISTPLAFLASWAFFALVLLVVARVMGGRGTLRQHITGSLLAAAPLFLFFFTFVPDVTPAMPVTFNVAFDYFGRILALIGSAWALLILVKSMSITHVFGIWRSLGSVILTAGVIYVVLPLLSLAAVGTILGR